MIQALSKNGFLVFNTGKPSIYKVFFWWIFYFVKSKASVAILGLKKCLWKVQHFCQLQDCENFIKPTFICLQPTEAGHIFKTKKLDLSMYCMREVAELSKSANFSGGDYNFRTDCTGARCHKCVHNTVEHDFILTIFKGTVSPN